MSLRTLGRTLVLTLLLAPVASAQQATRTLTLDMYLDWERVSYRMRLNGFCVWAAPPEVEPLLSWRRICLRESSWPTI